MVYTYNPAIDPFLLGGLTFQLYGLNLPKHEASHLASIGAFTFVGSKMDHDHGIRQEKMRMFHDYVSLPKGRCHSLF